MKFKPLALLKTLTAVWRNPIFLALSILLAALVSHQPLHALEKPSAIAAVNRSNPVLLGLYSRGYFGDANMVKQDLQSVDDWVGKQMSLAGFFYDIEDFNPGYNIPVPLNLLRQKGYTAFINLASKRSAAEIAKGEVDRSLTALATAYAAWVAQGSDRVAFIAPLPEMNGSWESYKEDPANFKAAFQRIQRIFAEQGIPRKAVRWVFAPNGWSKSEHRFENYYPGDDRVDVVGFSAYNWGFCSASSAGQWKAWDSPDQVFGAYIKRMRSMAPTKPIFISQTGTTSNTKAGANSNAKDQWLKDAYNYLAAVPAVRGILYFNLDKECDWAFYGRDRKSNGYKDAITNPAFNYVSPVNLSQMDLAKNLTTGQTSQK